MFGASGMFVENPVGRPYVADASGDVGPSRRAALPCRASCFRMLGRHVGRRYHVELHVLDVGPPRRAALPYYKE